MPSWTITILNGDGSIHGTATTTLSGPGVGQSASIPSLLYTCTHNHTLTGNQCCATAMGGTGVHPWPDPGSTHDVDEPPTWEATPDNPEPDE
jgi:hypothetical protein